MLSLSSLGLYEGDGDAERLRFPVCVDRGGREATCAVHGDLELEDSEEFDASIAHAFW